MPGVLLVNGIESDNEDLEFDCIGAGKTIKFKRDGVEVASIGNGGISGIPGAHELCKAWVNFNGNDFNIRNSFNVSSITDLGTGNYYIMFATNMVNNTYTVSCSSGHDWASVNDYLSSASKDRFTNKCNITVTYGHYQGHGGAYGDLTQNDVQIFGD